MTGVYLALLLFASNAAAGATGCKADVGKRESPCLPDSSETSSIINSLQNAIDRTEPLDALRDEEDWARTLAEIDYDFSPGTVSCPEYVLGRVMAEKKRGGVPTGRAWIIEAIREGHRRETDPNPAGIAHARPNPAPPPNEPISVPPVPDVPELAPDPGPRRPIPPPSSEPCFGGSYNCGPVNSGNRQGATP